MQERILVDAFKFGGKELVCSKESVGTIVTVFFL